MLDTIKAFIAEELLFDADIDIDQDTSLFDGKVLDSLNLVQLLVFLEKEFKIKINPSEVATENLDTIRNMQRFITSKKSS